jgi:hypothetical protein
MSTTTLSVTPSTMSSITPTTSTITTTTSSSSTSSISTTSTTSTASSASAVVARVHCRWERGAYWTIQLLRKYKEINASPVISSPLNFVWGVRCSVRLVAFVDASCCLSFF